MSTTIRITSATKARIDALAQHTGRQIQAVVDVAIADLERATFFDDVDRRFGELRSDPALWSQLIAERAELDRSLADWTQSDDAP